MSKTFEIDKEVKSRLQGVISIIESIDYKDNTAIRNYISDIAIPYLQNSLQNKLEFHNKNSKYNFIDLFAGTGGLSLGLESAGFSPVLVVDNYKAANQTYLFNRPFLNENKIISEDIKFVDTNSFEHTPLIVGGPPCQGFSNANKQRKKDDDRNQLYKFFVKSVSSVRPKIFLMENVEGILPFKNIIKDDFKAIDYTSEVFRINTNYY